MLDKELREELIQKYHDVYYSQDRWERVRNIIADLHYFKEFIERNRKHKQGFIVLPLLYPQFFWQRFSWFDIYYWFENENRLYDLLIIYDVGLHLSNCLVKEWKPSEEDVNRFLEFAQTFEQYFTVPMMDLAMECCGCSAKSESIRKRVKEIAER